MPDPNAKRDKALADVARAINQQNQILVALNENLAAVSRNVIPVVDHLRGFFENLEPVSTGVLPPENPHDVDAHEVCTPRQCKVAERDPEFNQKDCPAYDDVQYFVIPVNESSAMYAREAGYQADYHQTGVFGLVLPILKSPAAEATGYDVKQQEDGFFAPVARTDNQGADNAS